MIFGHPASSPHTRNENIAVAKAPNKAKILFQIKLPLYWIKLKDCQ
jgi:hypothetical protein